MLYENKLIYLKKKHDGKNRINKNDIELASFLECGGNLSFEKNTTQMHRGQQMFLAKIVIQHLCIENIS